MLLEAQEGNWDEIDLDGPRRSSSATQALRYADVPVVVAPAGLTLGGGCEIVLHGDRVQAAAESYIGLVEVGVGLIPAGGGTKEMLRAAPWTVAADANADLPGIVQPAFETIGFAKVVDERRRRAASRLSARRRRRHDEPRATDGGREGARACARARRLPAARRGATPSRSAATACWPR